MVTTTKNAVKECVVIVLYQLRNGGPLGLIEACSNSATQHSLEICPGQLVQQRHKHPVCTRLHDLSWYLSRPIVTRNLVLFG